MPAKTGVSHALAAFFSIILGAVISNVLSAHTGLLTGLSTAVGGVVAGVTGVSLPADVTGLLVISSFLAFFWGIAYHFARHGPSDGKGRPKNYVTDNQLDNQTQEMSQSGEPVADQTDDFPGQNRRYQTVAATREAEGKLQSKISRDIDDVKSRLDDLHDRFYDAGDREQAEHVSEVLDEVTILERTITATDFTQNADDETVDPEQQRELAVTHARVEDALEELAETVEDANESTGSLEECATLVRDLNRAIQRRQDSLERLGDIQ